MNIFFRMFELLLYLPLFIAPVIAWRWDLYRCTVFTGRSFFAFLLSMWLFGPLARLTGIFINRPAPYLNAAAFVIIWPVVWFLLPLAVKKVVKPQRRRFKFAGSGPGKILTGAVAGWFMVNALAAFTVMLPAFEGAYFANDAYPLFRRDRRSAKLYSNFTFTTPDVLLPAQMEAASEWIFRKIRRDEYEKLPEPELLPDYFANRYRIPWPAPRLEERREELREELEEMLKGRDSDIEQEES